MAANAFFILPPGVATNLVKWMRIADGYFYDYGTLAFVASGGTETDTLPEVPAIAGGEYRKRITPTPVAQWPDGNYLATATDASGKAIGHCQVEMVDGDDATPVERPQSCIAVSGSASSIVVSGLPAGLLLAVPNGIDNQGLLRQVGGEYRTILTQSYSAANYTFNFGTATGLSVKLGPFSSAPVAGEIFYPMP